MNRRLLFFIFVIVFLLAVAYLWNNPNSQPSYKKVKTFDDCAKAGFPVMESYPRICSLPDGRSFTDSFMPER